MKITIFTLIGMIRLIGFNIQIHVNIKFYSYLTHGLRHNCVIDQSATENKVIHTLIIDFFSYRLRSVKIEQELEKVIFYVIQY
jgi:hypothetical protein